MAVIRIGNLVPDELDFGSLRLWSCVGLLVASLFFVARPVQAKEGGWDLEPYHVQIAIALDVSGGVAEQFAQHLPKYIEQRVEASFAPAWLCETHVATGSERASILANITASDPTPINLPKDKDKLVIVLIRDTVGGMELSAREFDRYVQRWSPKLFRTSTQAFHLPEQLFSLICQTFSPLVQLEIDPKNPLHVTLKPRAAALPRSAATTLIAKPGDIYLPLLRRTTRNGELEKKNGLQTIPWTYIQATERKGNSVAGRFQSASRTPIVIRRQGRVEPVAIALHADPEPLLLRLHSRTAADKPLVGYEVFAQSPGSDAVVTAGVSDSAGHVTIRPGNKQLQFLLIKHGGQLFAKVPVFAGEKQRIEIPLPDDDTRLAAEASLAAVREDLIDVVARRNILISRARQKIEKKDFSTAQELLQALNDLPARPQFKTNLDAARRTLRSNDPQMQRRIDRLFDTTDSLLTQFLDMAPINKIHDELREAQSKSAPKTSDATNAKRS